MKTKPSIKNLRDKGNSLKPSSGRGFIAPAFTNTADCGENLAPATEGKLPVPPLQERLGPFLALYDKVQKATEVRDEDVQQLREMMASTPELRFLADGVWKVRGQVLDRVVKGVSKATMLAKLDLLTDQLGYESSPATERLLIDHALTCWLRMQYAEMVYTDKVVGQSLNLGPALYWEQFLAATQRRWLAAVESLARVRRLGKTSPAVQFNIAQSGSQQMNVQGRP